MGATVVGLRPRDSQRHLSEDRPYVPTDILVHADGSWGCSTDTMVNLYRWFEDYGYEFDPACTFDELVADLSAILRAAKLIEHIHALPSADPYAQYLHSVRKGNPAEARIARARLEAAKPAASA